MLQNDNYKFRNIGVNKDTLKSAVELTALLYAEYEAPASLERFFTSKREVDRVIKEYEERKKDS